MRIQSTLLFLILIAILHSGCKKEDVSADRNAMNPGAANATNILKIAREPSLIASVSGVYVISGSFYSDGFYAAVKQPQNDTIAISACGDSGVSIEAFSSSSYMFTYFSLNCVGYSSTVNRCQFGSAFRTYYGYQNTDVYFFSGKGSSAIDSISIQASWEGYSCNAPEQQLSLFGRKIRP